VTTRSERIFEVQHGPARDDAAAGDDATTPGTAPGRFVQRGNIRWHVHVVGHGPPLLLVHGTAASSHSFRALVPLLAERFTVIAPDLPGHALSTAPPTVDVSLPGIAAALADLLDALGVSPLVAVGHSAGAAVLARMALDGEMHPKLLVGIAAAMVPFRGFARAVFPPAAKLLARSRIVPRLIAFRAKHTDTVAKVLEGTGSVLDERGVELYRELTGRPDHVAAVLAMVASWDLDPLYAELPLLTTRFLLLGGALDQAVPLSQLRELTRRIPASRLVVVEKTGHLLHEEQPGEIARAIVDEAIALALLGLAP
jgi:magnesium chelatase accessory protein